MYSLNMDTSTDIELVPHLVLHVLSPLQVYCICTVSLLSIIIIFTTDNFVKHKRSQDIIVVYSG